jgi:hypothetical protein
LYRIDMKWHTLLTTHLANLRHRVDGSDFVVGGHN